MYSIGKLSKMTGVTIRTLDYYDEIGLIKPSSKTEGGHRLYDEDDVMRLEQVTALKYIGFSLKEIKKILEESTGTWRQSIENQLELVQQQQKRLQALQQALQGVLFSIEFEGEINWSVITEIIRLLQSDTEAVSHLFENYFNEDEQKSIFAASAERSMEEIQEWKDLFREISIHLGEDPGSEKAQQLAKCWMDKVYTTYGKDKLVIGKLWEMIKEQKMNVLFYPMNKDIIHFIDQAVTIMFKRSNQNEEV